MVTRRAADAIYSATSDIRRISYLLDSIAETADSMQCGDEPPRPLGVEISKCDLILSLIDQDWQSYRAAVAELRKELVELVTHR